MPGNSGQPVRKRGSRAKALVLLVASLWLLILFTCVANPWLTSAVSAQSRSLLLPTNTPTLPIPTVTVVPPTATLPGGGGKPTATTTAGPTATGVATVAATATPASAGGGGGSGDGGGGGGGYQGSGPQPTRVVLAQPTAGVGGGGGIQGLSPAAFGSNGLLVATTLSCVIAILGIVIAVIALNVLIRTGYGPFLRALLLGKRAGRRSTSEVLPAGAANGGRSGGWTNWDDEDGRYDDSRGSRGGRQGRAAPIAGRSPQPRQAPVARSRSNWR
ncbi:MAG: hypothetical protein ACXVDF_24495 [Ktedonobacterales bacterium]